MCMDISLFRELHQKRGWTKVPNQKCPTFLLLLVIRKCKNIFFITEKYQNIKHIEFLLLLQWAYSIVSFEPWPSIWFHSYKAIVVGSIICREYKTIETKNKILYNHNCVKCRIKPKVSIFDLISKWWSICADLICEASNFLYEKMYSEKIMTTGEYLKHKCFS